MNPRWFDPTQPTRIQNVICRNCFISGFATVSYHRPRYNAYLRVDALSLIKMRSLSIWWSLSLSCTRLAHSLQLHSPVTDRLDYFMSLHFIHFNQINSSKYIPIISNSSVTHTHTHPEPLKFSKSDFLNDSFENPPQFLFHHSHQWSIITQLWRRNSSTGFQSVNKDTNPSSIIPFNEFILKWFLFLLLNKFLIL